MPQRNAEYWHNKLSGNAKRDLDHVTALNELGWMVVTVWECEIRSDVAAAVQRVLSLLCAHQDGSAASNDTLYNGERDL